MIRLHRFGNVNIKFPIVIDPEGHKVEAKCSMGSIDITNCDSCQIKFQKVRDGQYALKGNYAQTSNRDETV